MAELQIECIVSEPFAENSYIVSRVAGERCFVVDPGFEPEAIIEAIEAANRKVEAILNTHGHVDHIAGNAAMKRHFPDAPLIIGEGDSAMLADPLQNLSMLTGVSVVSPPADLIVNHGDVIELLGLSWEVRFAPGHSPGHVVFVWHSGEPPVVFGGDVLFSGSVGRTDFPGGDSWQLLRSIRDQLYTLPTESVVYPGHGPATTIGAEIKSNPFTRAGGVPLD